MVYLVGVSGGTCSGKSTVCKIIVNDNSDIGLVKMDNFYKDIKDVQKVGGIYNFETMESIDIDAMVSVISELKKGNAVDMPIYSRHECRAVETQKTVPNKIMLIDGFLIFSEPRIYSMLDLKIFLSASEEVRMRRRMERHEKRGHTKFDLGFWNNVVQASFNRYGNTPEKADHVVDSSRPLEQVAEEVTRIIRGAMK
jgi:uridine kinase